MKSKSMKSFLVVLGLVLFSNCWAAQSIESLRKSCNAGNRESCMDLSYRYFQGVWVQKSYQKAAEYALRACRLKSGGGCDVAGAFYEKGVGVRQSYSKAKELYGKACDFGYEHGCEDYARLNR